MKVRDIVLENNTTPNKKMVKRSLPKIYAFNNLTNTDPYTQYRFGLAVAAASSEQNQNGIDYYEKESDFGERLIMVPRTAEEERIIELAQKLYGPGSEAEIISTAKSEESTEVQAQSPVAKPMRNKYGV
jgi:hypothetical protein